MTATTPRPNRTPATADPSRPGLSRFTLSRPGPIQWRRWAPLIVGVGYFAAVLIAAGTSPLDLLRYAGYVALALTLPGTLVYRALRRQPHTLVEDLAMGTAVGLVLELPAWVLFAALEIAGWLWLWPLTVVAVFAAVPKLRRHWLVRDYAAQAPLGWSWSLAGAVAFFTTYLSFVFLRRNPILPTDEGTMQYVDLAYQLSLAGEAKHQFPMHVPQVAAERLDYHWFGYAHMAATSLIGQIDLPVVALRLAVPGLCAAAIVLTAVLGWRVSGRPYVGALAAVLFFVIGETNFTHPVTMPFGTQATFVIWHGMSMIYSWVLLIALIAALVDVVDQRTDRPVPPIGPGAFVLTGLLMLASSGAKASSVPVVALALAITALVLLVTRRRIPWAVVVAGILAGAAQLFATAVLYRFQAYGVQIGPLWSLEAFWARPADRALWAQALVVLGVFAAFVINMQLRVAGVVPLLWQRRGRLEPGQLLLLSGTVAGLLFYLLIEQSGGGNQYFLRAGFTFAVVLSAWGYALVFERARLTVDEKKLLAGYVLGLVMLLVAIQLEFAPWPLGNTPFDPLRPMLHWALGLAAAGLIVALVWRSARQWQPALRGRGGLVALTTILLIGTPGLIMDMYKSAQRPNGGAYVNVPLPRSRVEAARWTREHSSPEDVVATNVHCVVQGDGWCDARGFWLSAYSERRVLVEGWAFAPRVAALGAYTPFWDEELLRRNDEAFTAPTAEGLRELREQQGVRWLVVDRSVSPEASDLPELARLRFDNGRMAVYELA